MQSQPGHSPLTGRSGDFSPASPNASGCILGLDAVVVPGVDIEREREREALQGQSRIQATVINNGPPKPYSFIP